MSRARIEPTTQVFCTLLSDTDESSYCAQFSNHFKNPLLPLLRVAIPCQRHTSQHTEITTAAVRRDSACDPCPLIKLRLHPLQLRSYAANAVEREATGHGNPRTKEGLPI